jgi:uncharacterized alkaline shock family protein YloU
MSTAVEAVAPAGRPAAERGTLIIADRVVQKVAVAAAAEVDGVLPAPATGLTRALRPGRHITADASQHDHGRGASPTIELAIQLSVRYPLPVRATTAAVRDHVMERVLALTGREITGLDIDVTHLTHPGEERSPRVV